MRAWWRAISPTTFPGQPIIVPKNMPGAGHIRAANYVFSQAPKDGTTIAHLHSDLRDGAGARTQQEHPVRPGQFQLARIDLVEQLARSMCGTRRGIKSVEDATKRQVLMGGTGVGSYTMIYPTVMNSVLGTKFKLVTGYQSTAEIGLAMERGEIEGRAGNNFNSLKAENGEWLRDRQDQPHGPGRARARPGIPQRAADDRIRQDRRRPRRSSSSSRPTS